MIKHVVMWKFRQGTEEEMGEFLSRLGGLYGVIPQIKAQEIGVDCAGGGNYSAVLTSVFESIEDLNAYKSDPRHVEVSALCKSIREDRVAVDYPLD